MFLPICLSYCELIHSQPYLIQSFTLSPCPSLCATAIIDQLRVSLFSYGLYRLKVRYFMLPASRLKLATIISFLLMLVVGLALFGFNRLTTYAAGASI